MPASYTITGEAGKAVDATERTLEELGWIAGTLVRPSLGIEELDIAIPLSDPTGAGHHIPDWGQELLLRRDGADHFRGHVLEPEVGPQAVSFRLVGPAWWLAQEPISSSQTDGAGDPADRQQFVFGRSPASKYLGDHVSVLFARAVARGLPVGLDSAWPAEKFFEFPQMTISLTDYLSALGEILRPLADVATWWDHSTNPPEFHAERRADLPAHELVHGAEPLVSWRLSPRVSSEVSQVTVTSVTRNETTGATEFVEESSGTGVVGKRQIVTTSGPELSDWLPSSLFRTFEAQTSDYGATSTGWRDFLVDYDPRWADIAAAVGAFGGPSGTAWASSFTADDSPNPKSLLTTEFGGNRIWLPESVAAYADKTFETDFADLDKFVVAGFRPPSWLLEDGTSRIREIELDLYWYVQMPELVSSRNDHEIAIHAIAEPVAHKYNTDETIDYGFVSESNGIFGGGADQIRVFGLTSLTLYLAAVSYPEATTLYETSDFDFVAPPAGLAANLLSTQNFVPHDGYLEISEDSPTATPWWARKYNLSSALPALATAGAIPRRIEEDLAAGSTRIEVGAPPRFDFPGLVRRIRQSGQDNIVPIS